VADGVTVRVLVLSDTHLRPGRMNLPAGVDPLLERADRNLHAGDLVDPSVLAMLRRHAPVDAVLGNNDHQLWGVLPERLECDIEGVRLAMVHDSGAREGRPRRLRRWFPDADLVVYGHSHLPLDEQGEDGQRLFNPGSPTERRRAPTRTCGWLEIAGGEITDLRLVDLGR
jgi:putative phosphoesterase